MDNEEIFIEKSSGEGEKFSISKLHNSLQKGQGNICFKIQA